MSIPSPTIIASQTIPPNSRLIVCEQSGEWSAALRIELGESAGIVWECRRLEEAWKALANSNAAFVVVEATRENLSELVDRLRWLHRDFPDARAAVVADRGLADGEWLIREAGVIHFQTSPRELATLLRLAARHLAAAPRPAHTLAEEVWATLPWSRHSSHSSDGQG